MEERLAKKSLGQHFLRDKNILAKITDAAEVSEGEVVLEIGPGEGTLTEFLLQAGARVIAVEKDDFLYKNLNQKFEVEIKEGKLSVIHGDILEQNLESLVGRESYSVVANIPYNITGGIIRLLLQNNHQPKNIALLMQREVAERILARDDKQSLLSLSVHAYGKPKIAFHVSPGSFVPPPKVQSSLLVIKDISKNFFTEKNLDEGCFFETLHKAFNQKRKKVSGTLKGFFETEELSPLKDRRPEDLSLDEWGKIANIYCSKS